MVLTVRGRLRLTGGERTAAIDDLRAAVGLGRALGFGPSVAPVRTVLAGALPPEERDEAEALIAEDLAAARAAGLPRGEGVVLRAQGLLVEDGAAVERLRESTALLERAGARLELARSLVALGATLRSAGHRRDARAVLSRALELAARCGADRLAARAREELLGAGVRPRRTETSGVAALTASELRVARLAAGGADNRAIAQELFVTVKTVETHLSQAYAKLGLSGRGSRGRLRAALDGT
jgi:DNA-binding CsgD family transcriptional regulator